MKNKDWRSKAWAVEEVRCSYCFCCCCIYWDWQQQTAARLWEWKLWAFQSPLPPPRIQPFPNTSPCSWWGSASRSVFYWVACRCLPLAASSPGYSVGLKRPRCTWLGLRDCGVSLHACKCKKNDNKKNKTITVYHGLILAVGFKNQTPFLWHLQRGAFAFRNHLHYSVVFRRNVLQSRKALLVGSFFPFQLLFLLRLQRLFGEPLQLIADRFQLPK